jgi:purine-binding chemotaxis protein CheW
VNRSAGGEAATGRYLLLRVCTHICAVSVEQVIETMRPLPVEPLAGMPAAVRGLAIIRGMPVPVLDPAVLTGGAASRPTRFVTIRTGERSVALTADAVLGVAALALAGLQELPPLLREADGEAVAAIGTLDTDLLLVLRAARLVPDSVWRAMDASIAAS